MASAISRLKILPYKGSLIAAEGKQVQVSTLSVAGTRFTNPITSKALSGPPFELIGVPYRRLNDEEVLEDEHKVLMKRLERAVEKIRVLEVEKFMCRTKGVISGEDKHVAEIMSKEIVDRFLEKPIQYLRCKGPGNWAGKLKDLEILVDVLEGSCSSSAEKQSLCKRT